MTERSNLSPTFLDMSGLRAAMRAGVSLSDIAHQAHGDMMYTTEESALNDWFAEQCYSQALFTLPNMVRSNPALCLLANPEERYCIDLTKQVNWARGQKMRLKRRQAFRLSIDRDFEGSLGKLREFHRDFNNGTWFDDKLFALIVRAHQSNALSSEDSSASSSRTSVSRKVKHHVFELWDAETDQLLAVTAGFACGKAYHDYSMACFVRDKRSAGHVLSKTVAHLLRASGFEMWYWGFKNDYMNYYDKYGGRKINRGEFFDMWSRLSAQEPEIDLAECIASGSKALILPR